MYSTPQIASIEDEALRHSLQTAIDQKTKPLGALGQLESLALQLGLIQRSASPHLDAPHIVVFAADHGLAAEPISAFPREVTTQMVANMRGGGAAVNVFARQHGFQLVLVNAGVASPIPAGAPMPTVAWLDDPIAKGTASALHAPAMTADQCIAALERGAQLAADLPGNVIAFGEMGIGNTSAAALLLCALEGVALADAVGRGTGLDDAALARKLEVLERVAAKHAGAWAQGDALQTLQTVGGLEIAMMAGAMLGAASARKAILVDGFIACSAALVAKHLQPTVLEYCVFTHRSAERGAAHMLHALGAKPLLDLGLRLGEGTGALLAYGLVQAACGFLSEMASFASAGVSGAEPAA